MPECTPRGTIMVEFEKFSQILRHAKYVFSENKFKFDQGHVTKNQPITALILLSESLAK